MPTATVAISDAIAQQAIHCNTASNDRALSVKVRLAYLIAAHTLLEALVDLGEGEPEARTVETTIVHLRIYADQYREDEPVSGVFLGAVDDLRSLL